jgi:hypothetical protein
MADRRAYFREYMRKRRAAVKAVNSADKWTHVVLSPISAGPDRGYQVGERVNATGWRNRKVLERQRFIEPIRC